VAGIRSRVASVGRFVGGDSKMIAGVEEFVRTADEDRCDVELASCAPRCGIRARRAKSKCQVVSVEGVAMRSESRRANRSERYGANRNERYGANRSAGGEVAKGIYEKQPVGLCDTYVRSCPLTVTSPILYLMGSRAGRRREPLESIAEARIDNVSIETSVSDRNIFLQIKFKQRIPISKRDECEKFWSRNQRATDAKQTYDSSFNARFRV